MSECPIDWPTDDDTVGQSKEYIKWHLDNGKMNRCPSCNQKVKLYPRKITQQMALQLCHLYDNRNSWVPSTDLRAVTDNSNLDYSKLRFWELATSRKDHTWKITNEGIAFVEGRGDVPKMTFVFNNEVVAFSSDNVSFVEVLPEQFDLNELLDPDTVLEHMP